MLLRMVPVLLVSAFLVSCTSSMPVVPPNALTSSKLSTISEAFEEAAQVRGGTTPRLSVFPGRVPRIRLAGSELLAVPVALDPSKPHTMVVRSHVTRAADGTRVLFYPLVSLVSADFQVQQTLKPKYEFAFENGSLQNEFVVPAGVQRLLIHTDEEYFRGSFVGGTTTARKDPIDGLYGIAGALGGAAGAAVALAATTVQSKQPRYESKEFRFGEVGVVDVEVR